MGSTMGILIGISGAYILTDLAPRTPGVGGGGAAASHISPIFISNDLLNVWILSVLLSIGAGAYPAWKASRLSPLEALRG